MNNPLTHEEKYACATVAPIVNNSLDALAATAMAASNPRLRVISTLWRLRDANDAGEWSTAVAELAMAASKNCYRKYKAYLKKSDARTVAEVFLKWYVFPNCIPCLGTGHLPSEDSPQTRQDAPCPHCGGTGRMTLRSRITEPFFSGKPPLQESLLWLHDIVTEREHELSRNARWKNKP